jgi:SAM-dependent methyltransferase
MSSAEIERLRRQHETWRDATEATWRAAGFGPGQTILDLGCGPGFTSRDLADLVGAAGRVVAVDASTTATDFLRLSADASSRPNLDVITADAGDVDLTRYTFDGVFARWLFCYLPNPIEVVRHVVSRLRPGGTVAVIDYWNYLAIRTEPPSPLFAKVFAAVHESFRDAGGSLDVGGVLPRQLSAVGLAVSHITPLSAVGRPGSPVWTWIADFQALYLPTLIERHYLSSATVGEYLDWWAKLQETPGAFVFAPPMLSVVASKR